MKVEQLKDITLECVNQNFEFIVLISDINIKVAKNGNGFVDFIIQDASKIMDAKYWEYDDNKEFISSINIGEPVKIKVFINKYLDKAQIIIKDIKKLDKSEVDIKDLILTSDWNYDKMIEGLKFFYKKITFSHLQELLDKMIFSDDYFEKFSTHLAAKKLHHNYYHGLLQHTLEVLKFAYTVAITKELSNRQQERLIVMAMLHDWGKIIEYESFPNIDFTNEGEMLGHIFLGTHKTLNCINEIENFDEDDKLIILNGILSHHGKPEFGSPIMPKTIEAQILHQADVMSGNTESIITLIKSQEDEKEAFTSKLWNMENTHYYKRGI